MNEQLSYLVELGVFRKIESEGQTWVRLDTESVEVSLETLQTLVDEFDGHEAQVVSSEPGLDIQILIEEPGEEDQEESEDESDSSETFECPFCGEEFESKRSRGQHKRWCDPDGDLQEDEEEESEEEEVEDQKEDQDQDESSEMSETSKKSRNGSEKVEEESSDSDEPEPDDEGSSQVHEQSESEKDWKNPGKWEGPELRDHEIIIGLDNYERYECSICGFRSEADEEAQEHKDETGHHRWNVWTEPFEEQQEVMA